MSLLRVFAVRVFHAALLMLGVVVLNFLLLHLAPGDMVEVIAGASGGMTPELAAELRHAYGLDRPLAEQLAIYVGRALRGDLGVSAYFNSPVVDLILQRIPATLLLVGAALVFAIVAGTWLGVVAARRPGGWMAASINVIALVGFSAPVFWSGLMLLILFASIIPIAPVEGMRNIVHDAQGIGRVLDVLHHLALPALTLSLVYVAQYSRLARASMLEALGADYVRTARAKGLTERRVVFRHALRNAILPVVTVAGLQFANLLAGAVLVETVFNWPGMGRLAFESILRRDVPLILGILVMSAALVITGNLLTDLVYRWVDPRITKGALR